MSAHTATPGTAPERTHASHRGDRGRHSAALCLMLASGFAGLGYQIVWTQQSALWLGHDAAAVLAVVAAFFGGLALGALALGSRIARSPRPARWYAGCELVIAVWSLVLALGMQPVAAWLLAATGLQPTPAWQWAVAFCGTFTVLLPATAAMGATLPAMEGVTAQLRGAGQSIAALYASNTFGAVVGVLVTAFWLVPEIGLARTAGVCATLNLLCAAAALWLLPGSAPAAAPASPSSALDAPDASDRSARSTVATAMPLEPAGAATTTATDIDNGSGSDTSARLMLLLAATGLLGIGYEVLVVRVLSQVTENTVYTFAMLLAVYLVGTACGAAAYQRWLAHRAKHGAQSEHLRDQLLCLLAAACLLGSASLWAAEDVKAALLQALGAGMAAALASEAALALLAFGLPTLVMGALFSHLSLQARAAGQGFSRALGINTLGAAAAPLLFGVLLLPAWGPKVALLLVACGYLALTRPRVWRTPGSSATAGVALALAVWAPPLAFVELPEGGRIISYVDGATAAVSVVEDAGGVSRLRIDNRQQEGSSSSRLFDARQALLPILLHPAPQRALFLGLGTGVTASSAAEDPTLRVDAVELLPEVISASAHFRQAFEATPRLQIVAADARRFVRASPTRYDVIVADNFHPARSGSGALYTLEHFRAVRQRLSTDGLFCQWLPLHQLDLDTVRSIVQSFTAVYPGGWAMLASNSLETPVLGLVGRADNSRLALAGLSARLAGARAPLELASFAIVDELALLGGFVAGPAALARFAGSATLNTDDRPVVASRAPRITYAPDSLPRERLLALLEELTITPQELLAGHGEVAAGKTGQPDSDRREGEFDRRLAAYWAARDRFIEAGRHVRPTANPQQMLDQVREPLLGVLRISPDFRPALDPLLRMAASLNRSDPAAASALRADIALTQPGGRLNAAPQPPQP